MTHRTVVSLLAGPVDILHVEEKTGLPAFVGLARQPQPGTMPSPGEFYQGAPTDFTIPITDHRSPFP
jgi:hypothetical protein